MNDEAPKRDSLLPAAKGKKYGLLVAAFLAVIAPAWGGLVNSFNEGAAEHAQARASQANEKADLAYKLLKEKGELERKAMVDRLELQSKRIDRIEEKVDRLLMRSNRRNGNTPTSVVREVDSAKTSVNSPPSVKKAEKMELPTSLSVAFAQKAE